MKFLKKAICVLCAAALLAGCGGAKDSSSQKETTEATTESKTTVVTTTEAATTTAATTEAVTTEAQTETQQQTVQTKQSQTTKQNNNQSSNNSGSNQSSSSQNTQGQSSNSNSSSGSQSSSNSSSGSNSGSTPYAQHGALSVSGTNLVDKNGQKFQLYGMSTHGIAWYPQYVNYDAFKTLRDDWGTNCIRLAMYTYEYGGYCSGGDQENLKQLIRNGVKYATELGMYVIIDWHVLNDQNPKTYQSEAISFFNQMSSEFASYDNIIYEICNEPNGSTTWSDVKSYAEQVIPVIRSHDANSVILVGSPTWSQDVDKAAADRLNYSNIMYTLHFYAATHTDWLRNRVESVISSGLPIFISEFGTCDSSGNGSIDYTQSSAWKSLIDKYNLSYCCWSLSNKAETCSVISSSCSKVSGWSDSDLSEQGKLIKSWFKSE